MAVCQAMYRLDPALIWNQLGEPARRNLTRFKRLYGNTPYPGIEMAPAQEAAWSGDQFGHDFSRIAAEHLTVSPLIPPPHFYGNEPVLFDFDRRAVPYTSNVPHLQPR